MSEILTIKDLKLNYGPIAAIKGIDITVEKGQIVAILGANGAGKTSTLKVISGLLKPTAGEIIFDGNKISGEYSFVIPTMLVVTDEETLRVS